MNGAALVQTFPNNASYPLQPGQQANSAGQYSHAPQFAGYTNQPLPQTDCSSTPQTTNPLVTNTLGVQQPTPTQVVREPAQMQQSQWAQPEVVEPNYVQQPGVSYQNHQVEQNRFTVQQVTPQTVQHTQQETQLDRSSSQLPTSLQGSSILSTAHTAVVLAKTQASAAREEARALAQRLNEIDQSLKTETDKQQELIEQLDSTQQECLVLDKELAVNQTRLEEIADRAEHEYKERLKLAKKIERLEQEKDELHASMGWWSRRRNRKLSSRMIEDSFLL